MAVAKTIKGITIEIGGNVSPLSKSLESINDKSKGIQSQLRAVNELLKFDPTNTDALTRKQTLLAEAVNTAKEKLEFLKSTQAQIEEKFKNKQIDDGAYKAFQNEVTYAEANLRKAEKAISDFTDECEKNNVKLGDVGENLDKAGDEADSFADKSKKSGKEVKEAGENSEKAGKKAKESGDKAREGGNGWEKFGSLAASAGKIAVAGIATVTKTAVEVGGAAGTAFLATAEGTRELRTSMSALETTFQNANLGAENAKKTYGELYSILGDEGKASEAATHIAQLVDTETELATWTNICTGVYSKFQDSLPIEGLAEAANETAKTGQVTGVLADALNWSISASETFGLKLKENIDFTELSASEISKLTEVQKAEYEARKSQYDEIEAYNTALLEAKTAEDKFNIALQNCSDTQERQQLITETLNKTYAAQAQQYKELNADVIEANAVQNELAQSTAEIGAVAEPIMTSLKKSVSGLLQSLVPYISLIGTGLGGALKGTTGATNQLSNGINGLINTLLTKLNSALPQATNVVNALIAVIITCLLDSAPLLAESALSIVSSVIETLSSNSDLIISVILQLLALLISFISENLPQFIAVGMQIISSLIIGISEAIPQILQALVSMIPQLVQAVTSNLPLLVSAGITLLLALANGLIDAIPQLLEALPTVITAILEALLSSIPLIIDAGVQLLSAIVEDLPTIIETIVAVLPEIISSIYDTVIANLPLIIAAGVELFTALIKSMPEIVLTIAGSVPEIIEGIVKAITDKIPDIIGCGKDLIYGLWEGIKSTTSWIGDKISGFCDNLTDSIKDFFGIHSPSTVFRDLIGKNLVKGISVGVDLETPNLQKDVENQLGKVTAGIESKIELENSKLAPAQSGGRSTVLGGITLKIEHFYNNTKQDIRELTQEVMEVAEEYVKSNEEVFA